MKTYSKFLSIVILSLAISKAHSQESSVRVKNGSVLAKAVSVEKKYVYPEFLPATITFKAGKTAAARMNYNLAYGEIEFIASNGDTLLVGDPESISEITIGYDCYYYIKGEGHVEQVISKTNLLLSKRTMLTYAGTEKYAAYGQYSSTGAISTYTSYNSANGSSLQLAKNGQKVFIKKANFYFIDKNQEYYPATRSNLNRIFPKNKKELKAYFDTNTVNFDDEIQLKQLVEYCANFEVN